MPRLRPRISLLTALLLVTIFSLTISVGLLWREVGPLRAEVRRLRVETGQLTVESPDRIYGFQIPAPETDSWRWRIYLPPGQGYTTYAYSGALPNHTKGYNQAWFDAVRAQGGGASSYSPTEHGEVTIDCRLHKIDGNWTYELHTTRRDKDSSAVYHLGSGISQPSGDWLSKSARAIAGTFATDHQMELPASKRFLLLHLMKPNTLGGVASPLGATDGLAIWIEPGDTQGKIQAKQPH